MIKSIGVLMVSLVTTVAQTTYQGDLNNLDYSGLGPNGGIVTVTYDLTSGVAVGGLGSSFDLDLSFGAWDDTYTWGINTGVAGLFTVNETDFGSANAVVNPTSAPVVAGWQLTTDVLTLTGYALLGLDQVTGNLWESQMSPTPFTGTHSVVRDVSYGAFSTGPISQPIMPTGLDVTQAILVYEQVPEPSSLLLSVVGTFALFKRRR